MRPRAFQILAFAILLYCLDGQCNAGLISGVNTTTLFVFDGSITTTTELGDVISAPFTVNGRSVAFESSGDLLVNTNAGLFRTSLGSGAFTNTNAWGTTQGIQDIAVGADGWVAGVNTTTLFLFDGSTTITTELADVISAPFNVNGRSVAFESSGDLLVNTNAGLFRTSLGSGAFTNTNAWGTTQGIQDIAVETSLLNPVPEPSTIALFAIGAFGFAFYGWRQKFSCGVARRSPH